MEIKDTYKTITVPSKEVLYKEKNSKFFGYAFPINSENEIKSLIESLRKKHFNAAHFCYAFQILNNKKNIELFKKNGQSSIFLGYATFIK